MKTPLYVLIAVVLTVFAQGAYGAGECPGNPCSREYCQACWNRCTVCALPSGLTPVGAEKAGNKDGSISEWDGRLIKAPSCFKGRGTRYCDPFPEDKPIFTITKANAHQYQHALTVGQIALFDRYPDTYKMNVYSTRRTFANPEFIYKASASNYASAYLAGNGEALHAAVTGVPFPVPKQGQEIMWNHKLRFQDLSRRRWNNEFVVMPGGTFTQAKIREDALFPYSQPNITPESLNNVARYLLQATVSPPRLSGAIVLVHETLDQVKDARRAWQYTPGQRRLRRAPNVGYDSPSGASEGLRTADQFDTFNGATDRYNWKIVGKKEVYVAANSYRLHSDKYKYKEILQARHINQELPRYELRRVWVVEATVKPGTTHIYKRRTFYIEEDGWQIVAADLFDGGDRLWRIQETHTVMAYDKPYQMPICETSYDMQSGRYVAMALNNEDGETMTGEFSEGYFDPANVQKQVTK